MSRHSVLMLFLDEHQPTFALPPALPPAAIQHRLTANALLASVAQLYRVALSKKETYVLFVRFCCRCCYVSLCLCSCVVFCVGNDVIFDVGFLPIFLLSSFSSPLLVFNRRNVLFFESHVLVLFSLQFIRAHTQNRAYYLRADLDCNGSDSSRCQPTPGHVFGIFRGGG